MPSPHSLVVHGVSKRFGPLEALREVSFGARAGEVLGLIGPNGAGKTTLFECIAGLLPCAGRISGPAGDRTGIFYIPDGITPYPHQPARWLLEFGVSFLEGDPVRVLPAIEALRIGEFLDQRIATLSKGQRKRLLVALGLVLPQPVLLIDEPFDGLDLRQVRQLMSVLREEAARGRTLVVSIHQLTDAARACDQFVLLASGRVVGAGTIDELAHATGTPPDLEEVFLART